MAVRYDSTAIYLRSCSGNVAKLNAIDAIIDSLLIKAAEATDTDNINEYSLNDGQVIIKASYRGSQAIFKAIESYEALRQVYINRLNGRVIRLVDSKNFTGPNYGNNGR